MFEPSKTTGLYIFEHYRILEKLKKEKAANAARLGELKRQRENSTAAVRRLHLAQSAKLTLKGFELRHGIIFI